MIETLLRDLVRRLPVTCTPETSVRAAAQQMRRENVGSILVLVDGDPVGIVTNTDLRDRVIADGRAPEMPVSAVMSRPVVTRPATASIFEALRTLMRHRMHHLVVTATEAPGAPVIGVVSDQDIARLHGFNPVALLKRIERAPSVMALTSIRRELAPHLLYLEAQGVSAEDIIAVNTEANDLLTVRVLQCVEESLRREAAVEAVDLRWVWLSLGSEGRGEMSLKTDQDNALLYEDPSSEAEATQAQRWFLRFAEAANEALVQCGFTRCPGDVMARNPRWCRPLGAWKRTFRGWIQEPDPKALMQASIFFDLRGLHGDTGLVTALQDDLRQALKAERGFLAFMMHNALTNRPPLSIFGGFALARSGPHRHRFDLKLRGLMPLVDLARILALEAGYLASTHTMDRLQHVQTALPDLQATVDNARDAYRYLVDRRLAHHLRALRHGEALSNLDNYLDPDTLSDVQQQMLKAVFGVIRDMQEVLAHRYGAGMMRG